MTKNTLIKYIGYIFLSICGAFMTVFFSSLRTDSLVYIGISIGLSLAIFAFLCFKLEMPAKLLRESGSYAKIAAFLLVCTAFNQYYSYILNTAMHSSFLYAIHKLSFGLVGHYVLMLILSSAMLIAGFFILLWFVQWFLDQAKDFIAGLDRCEKGFMTICIVLLPIILFVMYNLTNVFYSPSDVDGNKFFFDVLYSSDSGVFMLTDEFVIITAPENDVRNLLFGVVNMPFGLLARLLSSLFFFIPSSYPLFLMMIQGVLLVACIVLLEKMVIAEGSRKLPFMLVMLFSFPTLFNLLNVEQYFLSVFWVILLVYAYVFRKGNNVMYYIGATGSMITSGILLPLLTSPENLANKKALKDLLRATLIAVCVFVVFGYVSYFCNDLFPQLDYWISSSAGASMTDKLLQFFNAVFAYFIMPKSGVVPNSWCDSAYDILPVETLNILGCLLFALAVAGFVLNRKKSFARICMGWLLLSVFILIIMGWGAVWNCMTLYGFYFAWAYISLVYMALQSLLARIPRVRDALLYLLAGGLGVINLIKISDLIAFAITNYPAESFIF